MVDEEDENKDEKDVVITDKDKNVVFELQGVEDVSINDSGDKVTISVKMEKYLTDAKAKFYTE